MRFRFKGGSVRLSKTHCSTFVVLCFHRASLCALLCFLRCFASRRASLFAMLHALFFRGILLLGVPFFYRLDKNTRKLKVFSEQWLWPDVLPCQCLKIENTDILLATPVPNELAKPFGFAVPEYKDTVPIHLLLCPMCPLTCFCAHRLASVPTHLQLCLMCPPTCLCAYRAYAIREIRRGCDRAKLVETPYLILLSSLTGHVTRTYL